VRFLHQQINRIYRKIVQINLFHAQETLLNQHVHPNQFSFIYENSNLDFDNLSHEKIGMNEVNFWNFYRLL
jgi:hypothetical protein